MITPCKTKPVIVVVEMDKWEIMVHMYVYLSKGRTVILRI